MASINMKSIDAKLSAKLNTKKAKRKINGIADKGILSGSLKPESGFSADNAADKYIEVLKSVIMSHAGSSYSFGDLGPTAVSALTNLKKGELSHIDGDGNLFTIGISFSGDLSRESVFNTPENDYGKSVKNIAVLLNNGYSFPTKYIGHGNWHGVDIATLHKRMGTQFMQEAERIFMASYAKEYNVKEVKIDKAYM